MVPDAQAGSCRTSADKTALVAARCSGMSARDCPGSVDLVAQAPDTMTRKARPARRAWLEGASVRFIVIPPQGPRTRRPRVDTDRGAAILRGHEQGTRGTGLARRHPHGHRRAD